MKIYLIDYNLDERENKKIYVSQYSSYKIGINVNGVDNSYIQLTKKDDGEPISSEGDFKGYNTYSFEADTPQTTTFNVWVPYSTTGITFNLDVITTDSTVAELSSGGGSTEIPADLELFTLKVGGDEPTISADASNLYLKGDDLKITAKDNDVIYTGEFYNSDNGEYVQGTIVNCNALTVDNGIDCQNGTITFNNLTGTYAYTQNLDVYGDFHSPTLTCN
jgi:hypothetical protein